MCLCITVIECHVCLCVQGDGISYESLSAIMEHMKTHQWSVDNLTFGSGGALLQKLHRDTQKCAYKCSYAIVNGKGVGQFNNRECVNIVLWCRWISSRTQ